MYNSNMEQVQAFIKTGYMPPFALFFSILCTQFTYFRKKTVFNPCTQLNTSQNWLSKRPLLPSKSTHRDPLFMFCILRKSKVLIVTLAKSGLDQMLILISVFKHLKLGRFLLARLMYRGYFFKKGTLECDFIACYRNNNKFLHFFYLLPTPGV